MSQLLDQADAAIAQHRLLRPGQSVLVAISGGVDSMVLLHVLHALSAKHGWRIVVAHLNHRLRAGSSAADERLVRRTAAKLKVPVIVERADVREFARLHHLSLEMAARELRHEFLARTASRRQIRLIALAHHADDQLELFFLRLLRGSGSQALAGMKWRNPSPADSRIELIRPFLNQPKSALRAYAAEHQIAFREDATNALLEIQRNRIRHELLPCLRQNYQPALDKTILRLMDIVGPESEFVTEVSRAWLDLRKVGKEQRRINDRPRSDFDLVAQGANLRAAFDDLPVAIQRRSLQIQLIKLGVAAEYDLVERLRTAADQPFNLPGSGQLLGPQTVSRNSAGLVKVRQNSPVEFQLGRMELPLNRTAGQATFDGVKLSWKILPSRPKLPIKPPPGCEFFDADCVGSPIVLRHWQPGDRFWPIGMKCEVKLQNWFANLKIPRAKRHQLLLAVTAQGQVFWVEGLRISEAFKLMEKTTRRLQWRWRRP